MDFSRWVPMGKSQRLLSLQQDGRVPERPAVAYVRGAPPRGRPPVQVPGKAEPKKAEGKCIYLLLEGRERKSRAL